VHVAMARTQKAADCGPYEDKSGGSDVEPLQNNRNDDSHVDDADAYIYNAQSRPVLSMRRSCSGAIACNILLLSD
jgi:hypothetical protein